MKLPKASAALVPISGNNLIACLKNSSINSPEPPIAAPIKPKAVPTMVKPAPAAIQPTPSNAIAPAKPNNDGIIGVNTKPAKPRTVNAPANANNIIPTPARFMLPSNIN